MLKISILDISFKITKLISQPGTSCLINTAAVSYFMHKSIPANTTTQTDKNTLNCSLQYIRSFNSHITGYPYQFAYPLFCHSLCRVVFCKVTAASRNSQTVPPSRQGHQPTMHALCNEFHLPRWYINHSRPLVHILNRHPKMLAVNAYKFGKSSVAWRHSLQSIWPSGIALE